MTALNQTRGTIGRRHFLGAVASAGALAALARTSGFARAAAADAAKPNSVFNGVHVGAITYSYRDSAHTAEETLKALVEDGLSECELMDGPIRAFAGITGGGGGGGGRRGANAGNADAQPKPPAAGQRDAQLAKCAQLRKMFNDAGVNIHIHKLPFGPTDDDINFNFEVAKALGCVAITTERNDALARKLAPFADKHKIFVAFHNHTNNVPKVEDLDPLLATGEHIAFNFDIGHYVAGTKGKSPIPVIEKYHDRIMSLHLKDRTPDGGNLPWGQGKTPIKQVLQLLKKEKWPIYCDIELEYAVPKGSTSVAEVAKCVQYCKEALA